MAEFGRDHYLLADWPESFTDKDFVCTGAVRFGCIEEGDTAIDCSSGYLESHGRPKSPRDLLRHRCINFRHGDARQYRWEFEKGKKSSSVAVSGPLIGDDLSLATRAALEGVGLAYMSEEHAAPHLASGSLVRVLEAWCKPYPGFFSTIQAGDNSQLHSLH